MEKYYLLKQITATGGGYIEFSIIVTSPRIEGGGIHATMIGDKDLDRSTYGHDFYKRVEDKDFLITGNVVCQEIENPFEE